MINCTFTRTRFPGAPHRSFQNVRHAQRLTDFAQIARARFVLPHRSAADDFQVGDLGQVREDIILDAVREILVLLIVAQIFERQDRDAFFRDRYVRSLDKRCRSGALLLFWREIIRSLHAFRSNVESPGQHHRHRETRERGG